jgi:hypothetical protein
MVTVVHGPTNLPSLQMGGVNYKELVVTIIVTAMATNHGCHR